MIPKGVPSVPAAAISAAAIAVMESSEPLPFPSSTTPPVLPTPTDEPPMFSIEESMQQMSLLLSHPLFLPSTTTQHNPSYTTTNNHPNNNNAIPIPQLFSTAQELSTYIDTHFDTLLFDCDGVLYRDSNHVIPHTRQMLQYWIEEKKKTVFFVTNNAGQGRNDLYSKLNKLFHLPSSSACTIQHMITSGYSAARYLSSCTAVSTGDSAMRNNKIQYVHVVGEDALRKEFQEMGFTLVGQEEQSPPTSSSSSSMTRDELVAYPFDSVERMDALVVGLDTSFHYRKLCIATGLLQRHPHALFIATNEDAYDVVGQDNRHFPGNGSIVSALECASQRKAINVGKPTQILVDLLIQDHSLNPHRSLMVGDRLDTDVKFGLRGGMTSALVLTGCTDANTLIQTINESRRRLIPHVVFPHVGMMIPESTVKSQTR